MDRNLSVVGRRGDFFRRTPSPVGLGAQDDEEDAGRGKREGTAHRDGLRQLLFSKGTYSQSFAHRRGNSREGIWVRHIVPKRVGYVFEAAG